MFSWELRWLAADAGADESSSWTERGSRQKRFAGQESLSL